MADNDNDTDSGTTGTPEDAGATALAAQGSKGGRDEVSLLTSRLNGQTAKVGELTGQITAKEARIAELEALLGDKATAEDAAKALVAAKDAELARERTARRVDALKTKFPETFSELGDDVAAVMDETKLAAIEARLKGDAGEVEDDTPTPLRHNETKAATKGQPAKEESADDVEATLLSLPMPW